MAKTDAVTAVFPGATEVQPPAVGLFSKLVRVMSTVGYVQKRGKNTFHGYKYATEADVAEKVREAFVNERIIMVPSLEAISYRKQETVKGARTGVTQVIMAYRLIDADTGETLEFKMPGEGEDPGDKGPYKAITGSEKYALMKLLLIPTGDDPEEDAGDKAAAKAERRPPPSRAAAPPVPPPGVATSGSTTHITTRDCKQIFIHAHAHGHDDLAIREWLGRDYGVENTKELLAKDLPAIMQRLGDATPLTTRTVGAEG